MERFKDNLMVQIRALASNAMESVDRFEKKFAKQSAKQKFDEIATPDAQPVAGHPTEPVQPADAQAESGMDETTLVQHNPADVPAESTHAVAPMAHQDGEDEEFDDDESQPLPTTASVLAANAAVLPANADVPTDLLTNEPVADEPLALAGADAAAGAHGEQSEPAHQETAEEEDSTKKGGSFFDQI